MIPVLLHIWGPITIKSYGFFVALGIALGIYALQTDRKIQTLLSTKLLDRLFLHTIIWGLIGGRLLFALQYFTNLQEWLTFPFLWQGGLSVQGAYITIPLCIYFFCRYHAISFFKLADRIALYLPLTQAIARIGCLFAGCCHGCMTHQKIAITYTNPDSLAILHTPVHPTQLYSSIFLFLLFLVFYKYVQNKVKPGQLVSLYIASASFERLINDYFRWEYTPYSLAEFTFFSLQQWIACFLIIVSILVYIALNNNKTI